MLDGYFSLAGIEIINNTRTSTYASNLGIEVIDCDDCLLSTVFTETYETPALDDAPWYDPAVPESAGFAGLFGIETDGLTRSTLSRRALAQLGDGAAISRARFAHREFTFTALAYATDRCALAYGMSWLSSALRGGICSDCGGDVACIYTCCPSPANPLVDPLRTMYDVGIIDPPALTDIIDVGTGCDSGNSVVGTVTFTMAAGKPWLWRAPKVIAQALVIPAEPVDPLECVNWVTDGSCSTGIAGTPLNPASCLDIPGCDQPPSPPLPPIPHDPCVSSVCYQGPTQTCTVIQLLPTDMPSWLDSVPILEIYAGSTDMTGVTVNFYANPTGRVCDTSTLSQPCATLNVPFVKAFSTLTVDGRVQRVTADCSGGNRTGLAEASANVFGPDGTLFVWPVFQCTGFCVQVCVPADQHASDATVTLSVASRDDSA